MTHIVIAQEIANYFGQSIKADGEFHPKFSAFYRSKISDSFDQSAIGHVSEKRSAFFRHVVDRNKLLHLENTLEHIKNISFYLSLFRGEEEMRFPYIHHMVCCFCTLSKEQNCLKARSIRSNVFLLWIRRKDMNLSPSQPY